MKEVHNTTQSQKIKDENSTKNDLSKIDKNKRVKSRKKSRSKSKESKEKKEPKYKKDVKVINLSNIKAGQLDRMINESEKLNTALKQVENQGSFQQVPSNQILESVGDGLLEKSAN